jgi:hypothetical protein
MTTASQEELQQKIAAWINDLAEQARTGAIVAELGEEAIPALRAYLRREPQVIPQARCFAVAMLARLHADGATEALREVLHRRPLHDLDPRFAESEYVVKSDAADALVTRTYSGLHDDVEFGITERLRVAVRAAGRFGFADLVPALLALLDDDVLADAAVEALIDMGSRAAVPILDRLDAWLVEARESARRRLAVLRALRALHGINLPAANHAAVRHASDDPHPAVRAAAALLVGPKRRDDSIVENLLRGAIGFDRELADACRAALDINDGVLTNAAARALRRNAEPDLYGRQQPLTAEQTRWLKSHSQWRGQG